LSLAGLPFTGGALAKDLAKGLIGYGFAGTLASLSSAASALLMLHFVTLLSHESASEPVTPKAWLNTRLWPAIALGAIFLPWLFYPAVDSVTDALSIAKLWDGLWPVLLGAALAVGLARLPLRLPRIPEGDTIVLVEAAFRRGLVLGAPFDRIEYALRQWPAASLALVAIVLVLAALVAYSG